MVELSGNKMTIGGGPAYCYCQCCGRPTAKESLAWRINEEPPIFTPLENRIYSRAVFGVHRKIFQKIWWVPLILEAAYICNFCEFRPKNGPESKAEEIIERIIVKKIGQDGRGKSDYIPSLGCWITFSRIRDKKAEEVFNYQMNLDQLKEVLAGLKEVEGNPFKVSGNRDEGN